MKNARNFNSFELKMISEKILNRFEKTLETQILDIDFNLDSDFET